MSSRAASLSCRACVLAAQEDTSDAKPQYPPRWQYFRSLGWLRPALTLLLLYCLSLGAIWALYKRLPDLQALEGNELLYCQVGACEVCGVGVMAGRGVLVRRGCYAHRGP